MTSKAVLAGPTLTRNKAVGPASTNRVIANAYAPSGSLRLGPSLHKRPSAECDD